ncbi:MAG: CDP-archaeol synthase [Clostridia bacterium]|nr:CDP-archaeol synthase [Clostridia bacterium]
MNTVISMYISLMPVIFAGSLNMAFVKTKIWNRLYIPIDKGLCLNDSKRLFGDNKTWKGFIGMIVCSIFTTILWGFLCHAVPYLENHNFLYMSHENQIAFNIWLGALFGLAYVICELPNSFLKRRFDIVPGKTGRGLIGKFFIVLDQIDSLIGCVFVVSLFYHMNFVFFIFYVILGGVTHYFINILLYKMGLRKNRN